MINLSGCHNFDAPREQVWPRIFDPVSLLGLIPGCEEIQQISPDVYCGRLRVGIASIRGTYQTVVKIVEEIPPELCLLQGELTGPTGVVQGQGRFELLSCGVNSMLRYEAHGLVSGALAAINHRLIESVVESIIKLGLSGLNKQLKNLPAEADKSTN